MDQITMELKEELHRLGADLVGIGDISLLPDVVRKNMTLGIAVAVAIEPNVIKGIKDGPTMEYLQAYDMLNKKLDHIVSSGAQYIHKLGYEAIAQTVSEVAKTETDYHTLLPHKTVATRVGIGWIGKNAMLVTNEYGSALRISAILTNAKLEVNQPVNVSQCKSCMCCKEACPGDAIVGANWNIDTGRAVLYDPVKCKKAARHITKERLNVEKTLCGKCVFICPFTQRYLNKQI